MYRNQFGRRWWNVGNVLHHVKGGICPWGKCPDHNFVMGLYYYVTLLPCNSMGKQYHHKILTFDGQCLWDHAITSARWQHPAVGHEGVLCLTPFVSHRRLKLFVVLIKKPRELK